MGAGPDDKQVYLWVRAVQTTSAGEAEAVGADEMEQAAVATAAGRSDGGTWEATVPVQKQGASFVAGNANVEAWALVTTLSGRGTFHTYWTDNKVSVMVK